MKKALLTLSIILGIYYFAGSNPVDVPAVVVDSQESNPEIVAATVRAPAQTTSRPAKTYSSAHSGRQIQDSGQVIRLLSDDNEGSRHQRFIVSLRSGQTVLVAHNIDLAPRVSSLSVNDNIEFNGEFEWNSQGGVVHWTHHDPRGSHTEGWLKHKGRVYK